MLAGDAKVLGLEREVEGVGWRVRRRTVITMRAGTDIDFIVEGTVEGGIVQ